VIWLQFNSIVQIFDPPSPAGECSTSGTGGVAFFMSRNCLRGNYVATEKIMGQIFI
jgi:hypothetical protein